MCQHTAVNSAHDFQTSLGMLAHQQSLLVCPSSSRKSCPLQQWTMRPPAVPVLECVLPLPLSLSQLNSSHSLAKCASHTSLQAPLLEVEPLQELSLEMMCQMKSHALYLPY